MKIFEGTSREIYVLAEKLKHPNGFEYLTCSIILSRFDPETLFEFYALNKKKGKTAF